MRRSTYVVIAALTVALAAVVLTPTPSGHASERRAADVMYETGADPSWSPDGRRIAYTTRVGDDSEIAVMHADGSGRRILTRNGRDDGYPDWSPDGRIVFTSWRDGDGEIYSMRPDGSDVVQLTRNEALDHMPDVSPDGRYIAFASNRDDEDDCQIYVMTIDGTEPRRLVEDAGDDHYPAWSSDGTRIAFEGGADDAYLDVVGSDGSGRVRLTPEGDATGPAWMPDGRIVFSSWEDGDISVVNADGTGFRQLLLTEADERHPAVSPDGRLLAYDSDADGIRQVYVARVDGTQARRLTGVRRAFTSTRDRCSIVGTPRADVLVGTPGDDVICGLGGNDRITGLDGDDVVDGGPGDDRLDGGTAADRLLGVSGDDWLVGGVGEDRLDGGAGADELRARDGRRDFVDGGAGRDHAVTDLGDWVSFIERVA